MAKTSTAVQEANRILRMSRSERKYREKHKSKRRSISIPIAVIVGFTPFVRGQIKMWQATSGYPSFMDRLIQQGHQASLALLGYNSQTSTWDLGGMKGGTLPIAAGIVVHFAAGKIGLNRILKRTTKWFVL